jgi:tight adherence protein C
METIIAIAVFGVVGAIMYLVLAPRAPIAEDMIQRRLETISGPRTSAAPVRLFDNEDETFWERVADFFFGSKEMPENLSKAGTKLHQAGYRGARAIRIYWGLRIFLGLALALTALLLSFSMNASMQDVLLLGGAAGTLGYMLPCLTVFRKAKSRVLAMREALPDTLDLIVICVEAGMGVDAALNRVGNEQNNQKLAIGEELLLATQEMQAGARRKDALIRLAERCGVDEIRGLVTFLTQTEELGGSIARSLRIYAETMRDKRSQSAEEAARKAVIKLIFPLVFFILPAIFIILLGPAGLQIMKALADPMG